MCRGTEVSEAKVILVSFIDNRAHIIGEVIARERLVDIGIHPSVNSTKTETGCKARNKCLFPHQKVDEQPDKKAKERMLYPHKRRKSDDKNAVAIVKSVPQVGCVSQDSDALDSQARETRCKESWDRFEEYESLSLRYDKQVSGKRKDHRLEKDKSKILISEVFTL